MKNEAWGPLLKKAVALLAQRAYSRGELRDRLAGLAGMIPLNPVLDRLEQLNLLNDKDYAYNFALRRITQNAWSPDKVKSSLLRRQVSAPAIDQALARIRLEIGDESALENYLQEYRTRKGLPADLKSLRKLFLHLRRRGFDEESVLSALRRAVPTALWQRFETGE